MLSAGSQAPRFVLHDLDGVSHALTEILDRGPVLLAIYKVSCPTCQFTLPFLERILNGSVQIIAISQDDASATGRFVKKLGLTMLTLLDREEEGFPVSNAFSIEHVPSMFLIESDGTISLSTEGFAKNDLEAIGARSGRPPFRADEPVPAWKAG